MTFTVRGAVGKLPILPFHELYREVKQTMPSGELWEVYKAIITVDGLVQRVIVMPPAAPAAAVEALRSAIPRLNADKAYAADAKKPFGFGPQWEARADTPTRRP